MQKRRLTLNGRRMILIILFVLFTFGSMSVVSLSNFLPRLFVGDPDAFTVLIHASIPRTITIILTAASLSIAGLIMQAIGRNRFISPSTIGTTDAALLGLILCLTLIPNANSLNRFIFAFVFALLSSFIFTFLISRIKFRNVIYVPLIGLMYGALISAITVFIAQRFGVQQLINIFNQGTFSHINSRNFRLILFVLPPFILAIIFATRFSIVQLGEDFAKNLGVNYRLVLFIGLFIVAVISAATFIVVGPIPFVGLIVPNIVTLYYGENVKKNLFDVALFGTVIVLALDIISRLLIYPYVVPISLTMGIFGAITFAYLIFRRMKHA